MSFVLEKGSGLDFELSREGRPPWKDQKPIGGLADYQAQGFLA